MTVQQINESISAPRTSDSTDFVCERIDLLDEQANCSKDGNRKKKVVFGEIEDSFIMAGLKKYGVALWFFIFSSKCLLTGINTY